VIRTRLAGCLRNRANRLDPQPDTTPDRPEVYIDTPGPSVTVKAAGDLDTVAAKARSSTIDKADRAKSPGSATGFSAERSEQW
jgi:hypothetical protein